MSDQPVADLLRQRLDSVESRIRAACDRANRPRADVTLVAVTKTVGSATAALLPALGQLELGESRPQELWSKAAALPGAVRWHMIGNLQRNKVERTLPLVQLIHSVDSPRLLEALEAEAQQQQRTLDVLLEVNASREASKHGFTAAEVAPLAPVINALKAVRVRGLMTMAAPADDPEQCRPTFAELRRLRDRLRAELAPPHDLVHLSMGMSDDFEIAIEEGATLIRLGSVLFAGMT